MESFFGTDFSDVRVHVGPEAPSIGALAFTIGSSLYFAPGQYNPNSPQGLAILGHELTHVVQQRQGRVRNPFGSGIAVVQDPHLEAEADRMGQRAASHQPAAIAQAKQNPAAAPAPKRSTTPPPASPGGDCVQQVPVRKKGRKVVKHGHVKRTAFWGATQRGVRVARGQHRRHIIPSHLFVTAINRWRDHWTTADSTEIDTALNQLGRANLQAVYEDLNNHRPNLVPGSGAENSAIGMISHRGEGLLTRGADLDNPDEVERIAGRIFQYGGFQQGTQRSLLAPIEGVAGSMRRRRRNRPRITLVIRDWYTDVVFNTDFDWPIGEGYTNYTEWKSVYDAFLDLRNAPGSYDAGGFVALIRRFLALTLRT